MRDIQPYSRDEFVSSAPLTNIAERQFQVAIQAAIDIGAGLLSDMGVDTPKDYADIMAKLGEVGILPSSLASRLAGMVKFRNVLVHLYLEVDLDKVYKYIQEDLGDLELFVQHVTMFLERSGEQL